MLTVQNLTKAYGIKPVFKDISFTVNAGERVGLIGPNGSGKTTILRIVAGQERADSGVFRFSPGSLRVGYLPQGGFVNEANTIEEFLNAAGGESETVLTQRLEALAGQLAQNPTRDDLQVEYDDVLARLAESGGSDSQRVSTLAAVGLADYPGDTLLAILSGGQKTRLALARVLLSNPRLILLDEPTNHLDIAMLDWLEDWLARFNGGVLLVSHDRTFLDHVINRTLELDPATLGMRAYEGNYTAYLEQKIAEKEKQWQAYTDQQDQIARLTRSAAEVRSLAKFHKGGKADPENTDKFSVGFFMNRGKETVQRAKNLEKRVDRLMNEDKIEKPRDAWQVRIAFDQTAESGRDVLVLDNLSAGYPDEDGDLILLSDLNLTLRYGERAALIGPNGSGKTTLMRTIQGLLPPLAGRARLGSGVKMGVMAQEQEDLDPALNALETIQAAGLHNQTEARRLLSKYLFFGDDVFTPAGQMSYGERARLVLARLVATGVNFLLLDEPINHLDIPSRTTFEQALAGFKGTALAVVHDRYFIQGFATQIWEVKDSKVWPREKL